ncbi:hypothetical protein K3495_g7063 [Podosphaera aphanis]|nr:hypothetical protein K3495_g7063 [Podosphaera aphanis]
MASHENERLSTHNNSLLTSPVIAMPQPGRIIDTKPRLGKKEVEILEREFKRNPKPLTLAKKALADEMNVDLPRINNWFQNRRAKRKQEMKIKDNQEGKVKVKVKDSSATPAAPSLTVKPEHGSKNKNHILALGAPVSTTNNCPTLAISSPKPTDNIISMSRSYQQSFTTPNPEQDKTETSRTIKESMVQKFINSESFQTSTTGEPIAQLSNILPYDFPTEYDQSSFYTGSEQEVSPNPPNNLIYPSSNIHSYYPEINMSFQESSKFPCQLLQECNTIQPVPAENILSQPDMECNIATYGDTSFQETSFSESPLDIHVPDLGLPPASSNIPFRSRPPINLASRRKKVQHRPAALLSHTLIRQPPNGPQTLSHIGGFIPLKSPITSPIRRIVSAGGNRVVASGRIKKQGLEVAQRSPVRYGGFEKFGTRMDRNFSNCYNNFSLTGPSSLGSSLAPSTPLSPMDMVSARSDGSQSTASPIELGTNYVFNHKVPGCFVSINEENPDISSPSTAQSYLSLPTPVTDTWTTDFEKNENFWPYEVSEPLYSAKMDNFPLNSFRGPYSTSVSQPVTPAFDSPYSANYNFGQNSPQNETQAPCSTAPQLRSDEYPLLDTYQTRVSPMTNTKKNKTFLFSHTTPADFSEK